MAGISVSALLATKGGNDGLPQSSTTGLTFQQQLSRRVPSSVYVAAFELGAIGLCGTLCNTAGISRIPALQGAVLLTFLNVVTPFISVLVGATEEERRVDVGTWAGSALAICASIYALLPDGVTGEGSPLASLNLGEGQASVLAATFFFAAAKVRLSSHLKVHDDGALTTGRMVGQAGLAALGLGLLDETGFVHELLPESYSGGLGLPLTTAVASAETWASSVTPEQAFWIGSSSFLSGAGALWCQGKAQSSVPASQAQLYFSSQTIFAAGWALLLLGEPITNHEIVGGAVLAVGLVGISKFILPVRGVTDDEVEG